MAKTRNSYSLLQSEDKDLLSQDDQTLPEEPVISAMKYARLKKLNVLLSTLVAILLLLSFSQWFYRPSQSTLNTIYKPTGLDLMPTVERMIQAPTPFFSENMTAASETWEAIEAGHGLVTVDSDWASSMNLEETMPDPSDPSKSIYMISAYHDMHCIQYIRNHYFRLLSGEPVTWPLEHDIHHSMHCFDSLRQSTMCNADSTLLHTWGHRDVGDGETVMCRDWDALRDWATERSACYEDLEYPSSVTRWGRCDGGEDGLPRGSLLGEL